jgi:hypothetical protein
MNMGSAPTDLQERTGELTPPGITAFAFSNIFFERVEIALFDMTICSLSDE